MFYRLNPRPCCLGLAAATTSGTFLRRCEQRIRLASFASVADLPATPTRSFSLK